MDNIKIIELASPVGIKSGGELLVFEDKYVRECIDDEYCLNNNQSYETKEQRRDRRKKECKQWRQDNYEHAIKYGQDYNKTHKNERRAYKNTKVKCVVCNCTVLRSYYYLHIKCESHIRNFIEY